MLHHLEVQPPPGVWPEIAARLNTEFDADEVPVAQKMYDLEVTPPAAAWSNIAAALPQQQPFQQPAKVIAFPVRRAIAAAAALVLITLSAWYFLNNTSSNKSNEVVAKQTSANPSTENNTTPQQPAVPSVTENNEPPTVEPTPKSTGTALSSLIPGKMMNRYANRAVSQPAYYISDYQPIATSYAGVNDVQAVNFTNSDLPSVEGPLIRDANGQIILDKKLITSPDDCYITITGPNGEQTRISSKFLHIISSLNDDVEPQDYFDFMMQENSLWKMRFREWKNKLLNQSYIPSATSFTDILELKDLLQEN